MLVLVGWRRVERHIARTRRRCATRSQQVLKMPRTKDIPRRCEGDDLAVREQQRAAAALAAVPAPAPHRDALQAGGVGASEVTVKEEEVEEEEEEEEKTPEEPRRDRLGLALGPAGMLASGPRATLVSAPVPAHQDHAPPTAGAGASGVTLVVKEETEQEETLAQLRDRLRLCARVPAPGPLAALVLIKVEDSTSGEDSDGDGEGGEEVTAGDGGDGEGEQRPGGEGGLLVGAAHVPEDDGGRGGGVRAPRRSTPADRAARAKQGRGDVAADVGVDASSPKRKSGGAHQGGESGRHGVYELTEKFLSKATPWLEWGARLHLPGIQNLHLGSFATVDVAARAYDAEVRRRGWAHMRRLNFPQPEEQAAYAQAGEERCDERGLPLSLAPEPAISTQGASGQLPPKLSAHKPGKSGFFGVTKKDLKNKATPWLAQINAGDADGAKRAYVVGYFSTKEEAARAYDAEVRRRGWTHLKRLNFTDPADDAALPPSSAAAAAPGLD